jgi:hypothetical protein
VGSAAGVGACPSFVSFRYGVFDPAAAAVMSEAFDAACEELHDTGQPEIVLEVIAERIITVAKTGGVRPRPPS